MSLDNIALKSDSFDHNAALRRFTATGIMSAYGLFGSKVPLGNSAADAPPDSATTAVAGTGSNLFARVQHVVVEFGPPRRWSVAKNNAEDGARVLAEMENDYGFEPRYELLVDHSFARKGVSASLTADCSIYVRHFVYGNRTRKLSAFRLIDSLVWNDYNRKFRGGALERSTTDFVRSLILHLSV